MDVATGDSSSGDTVIVQIVSDENIVQPTVHIADQLATVTGEGTEWTAAKTLGLTLLDGLTNFTIDFTDLAGN